jgi:hypothetical protein
MNNKLTKEQRKQLKSLEPFLRQAQHDYLVNQTAGNKEIVFKIHREIFGGDLGKPSCPTCTLRTYKRVAELYFAETDEKQAETSSKDVSSNKSVEPIDKKKEPQNDKKQQTKKTNKK